MLAGISEVITRLEAIAQKYGFTVEELLAIGAGIEILRKYDKEIETKSECVLNEHEDDMLGNYWTCSNCGNDVCFDGYEPQDTHYNYCQECGAKIIAYNKYEEEEEEDD